MSFGKAIGTILGGTVGVIVAALFITGLKGVAIPHAVTAAVVLLGCFLGSGLGGFIGSDDRHPRTGVDTRPHQG